MKSIITGLALFVSICFVSCKDDVYPSDVPTIPYYSNLSDVDECYDRYVDLEVAGSLVEDDLDVKYRYYLSTDCVSFEEVNPIHIEIDPHKTYYWYAIAVSVTKNGAEVAKSDPTPIRQFTGRKVELAVSVVNGEQFLKEPIKNKYEGLVGDTVVVPLNLSEDAYIQYISSSSDEYTISTDTSSLSIVLNGWNNSIELLLGTLYASVTINVYDEYSAQATLVDKVELTRVRKGEKNNYYLPDKYSDYFIDNVYCDFFYDLSSSIVKDNQLTFIVDKDDDNNHKNIELYLAKKQTVVNIHKDACLVESVTIATTKLNEEYSLDISDYCNDEYTLKSINTWPSDNINAKVVGTLLTFVVRSFEETNSIDLFLIKKQTKIEIYKDNSFVENVFVATDILNKEYSLDLSEFFEDEEDCLSYFADIMPSDNINASVDGNLLKFNLSYFSDYSYNNVGLYFVKKQTVITVFRNNLLVERVTFATTKLNEEYSFDFSTYCGENYFFEGLSVLPFDAFNTNTEGNVLKFSLKYFGPYDNNINLYLKSKE
ncbi:MAG: hypothetical protein J6Y82_07775 [Bacteroidales bacterium]|nr:hypothetical protein [Bacteroidales bacterium]